MTLIPLVHNAISLSGLSGMLAGQISATAFANQMLAAKSVMDASDERQIQAQLPTIYKLVRSHKLRAPNMRETSYLKVDVGYFNNVFKPHFAYGLREVFDARMSARRFYAHDQAELRQFVSILPDVARAGLLTFQVVRGYSDEQNDFINAEVERTRMLDVGSVKSAMSNYSKAISGALALFGASVSLALLEKEHFLLASFVVAGVVLMMYFVNRSYNATQKVNMSKRQQLELQMTQAAIGTLRAKLRTHWREIIFWSEMPLPPIS